MYLKNKKVLIVGLAKTGISVVKKLTEKGANIIVNDMKTREGLKAIIEEIYNVNPNVTYYLGSNVDDKMDVDLVVLSPGVPYNIPIVKKFIENGIEVIGEIELASRLINDSFVIGITGTNGKTTTTSLISDIIKNNSMKAYTVGNIGNPMIEVVDVSDENSYLVTEISSFQLETIVKFRPNISVILNITEDHLDRHKTIENYINAKANIFKNQVENDVVILNYDDVVVRELASDCKSKVVYFSKKDKLKKGVFVNQQNMIEYEIGNDKGTLIDIKELSLPGSHNLENALAAIAVAICIGVEKNNIVNRLKNFNSVEHRLEYVNKINGVKFINDSKGTNPDSTIKAIESFDEQITLIAGGKDKGSEFDDLVMKFNNKVKNLILMGETKYLIKKTAIKHGFKKIYIVDSMDEAVKLSYLLCSEGEVVLLSPACASLDMYVNFEERGNDFKKCIANL